jgi:hypothetical protein
MSGVALFVKHKTLPGKRVVNVTTAPITAAILIACASSASHAGMASASQTLRGMSAWTQTVTRSQSRKALMADTFEVRHISVSIVRPPGEVYAYISDGANLALWATGLGASFQREGDLWLVQGPLGSVRVRIAPLNEFGVADQTVTLQSGVTVHNPIRVVANGEGSTVTFTLMRLPGVSERKFNDDAKWVEKDLMTLKAILERPKR